MARDPKKPLNDDARELVRRARMLLRGLSGDALQSGAVLEAVRAGTAKAARLDDLELVIPESPGGDGAVPPSTTAAVAAHDVVQAAQDAIDTVGAEGTASNVTDFQFAALEAIVQLTGRPAIRYTDGRVQSPPNDVGDNEHWRTIIAIARTKINRASASVGQVGFPRAGMPAFPAGTAWRLGDDLVVTNRHVALEFVRDANIDPTLWTLDPSKPAVVNFNITDSFTTLSQFAVSELVYCAAEPTVDLAIFRLSANGSPLPAPLPLDWDAESVGRHIPLAAPTQFQGEDVYVVGHPYRDIATSATSSVFGVADGFKRCSPGRVTLIPADRDHAFEHNCSTLGGNSGSCVLSVSGHKVVGLHYGGLEVGENGVGRANVALGLARLGDHHAAEILRKGRVA